MTSYLVGAAGSVRAQAKLNLSLRVLAREASGYHQIETLFCRLDLADVVRVELTDGPRSLTCGGPALPPGGLGAPEENLAFKAAAAFLDREPRGMGFHIAITKHIPTGGGLGGGSADAGAVLRILHRLTGTPPQALAGQLGADVPFLAQDECSMALAWGRGDRMFCLPSLPRRECVLVTAPFGVNTAAAYGWLDCVSRPSPGDRLVDWHDFATWESVRREAGNDFEAAVFPRHPPLRGAAAALRNATGPEAIVQMSGSGSTIFAIPSVAAESIPDVAGLPDGFSVIRTATSESTAAVVVE